VAAEPGPDYTSVFRGVVDLAEAGFDEVSVREGFTGMRGELMLSNLADPWDAWETGSLGPLPAFEAGRSAELRNAVDAVRLEVSPHKGDKLPAEKQDKLPAKLDATLSLAPDAVRGDASGPGSPGSGSSGSSGGSGAGTDDLAQFPFTFDVQKSGGPNTVTVGFAGESVTLDKDAVEAIVDGDTAPLGNLNGVVNSLGIDPQDLGEYLDDLI
jgi:hypothetical protein